ncbi:hypothetical protein L7F22_065241 [Adiantum nelumboides]|nr:hypothetical protein [Adiantum nelumboides]
MANKCLRRCTLRSGLIDHFFAHHHSHSSTHRANKLSYSKLHSMQELSYIPHHHHHHRRAATSCSAPCLPLQCRLPSGPSALICLQPQLAASSPPSAPRFISSAAEAAAAHDDLHSDLQVANHLPLQHKAHHDLLSSDGCRNMIRNRSHSCSKLQCRLNMVPSLKSLLHRSHSHGRNSQACSSKLLYIEDADDQSEPGNLSARRSEVCSPSSVGEYTTRPWSSQGLRKMKTAGSRSGSFNGELDVEEGGRSSARGKVKRAPKGHVAVYVEGGKERHVVPISYLSHPQFRELLERAESEFGFGQKAGLLLPCSLAELQRTLHHIRS